MRTKASTILGSLLIAVAIGGCGGKSEAEQARDGFMKGCTGGGGQKSYCDCLYSEIKKAGVKPEDFKNPKSKQITEASQKATQACASKLGG
jgi:hypothetical protein